MKILRVIVPVLVIALAMFSTASANNRTFIAKLSGSQEVPPATGVPQATRPVRACCYGG